MLRMSVFFVAIMTILFFFGTTGECDEIAKIGISPDGITWFEQDVVIPDDDYIVINLNGTYVVVWGPNYDPSALPSIYSDLCQCNAYNTKCFCTNHCRKHELNDDGTITVVEGYCR